MDVQSKQRANTNQLEWRWLMLSQSYAAVRQFQSQISTINKLQDLKPVLSPYNASLSIQISSPTIWVLDWNVCDNSVSGTLDLRLEPKLLVSEKEFLMRDTSFRLQDPSPNSLASLEERLMGVIKQFVENIY